MSQNTGFRMDAKMANEIARNILEEPNEPVTFFQELHNVSHSTILRIKNGQHQKLTPENLKALEKMRKEIQLHGKATPLAKKHDEEMNESEPFKLTKMQSQKQEQKALVPATPPPFSTKELLCMLQSNMQKEHISNLHISVEGKIVVTKQEVFNLLD